jgi:3'-phosphoadenosine 5'-phosphosulfate sulfotransferase (PAPS reductase)/FAD synthetase
VSLATLQVASISGGKDSQAVAIILKKRYPAQQIKLVFADTGNEHQITLDHLDYLREALEMPIDVVRGDFAQDLARKRRYCLEVWPTKGVPLDVCERAAAALEPTGVPYFDLCLWKGRFPARRSQFCTQFLKRYPLDRYCLDLMAAGHSLQVWQGVRRDESQQRAAAIKRELTPEGWWIRRPIAAWTARQVIDLSLREGIKLNPLYSLGFGRVGCAPCINAKKSERIREWERLVGIATKRGASSFFPAPNDGRGDLRGRNIDDYLQWSLTTRGGRQYDMEMTGPVPACSSVYGLCE